MKYLTTLTLTIGLLLYILVPTTSAGMSPQVTGQTPPPRVKELPKTGLPAAAIALVGLIPIGLKLKNIGKISEN